MKWQARLLFLGAVLALAIGWLGLKQRNATLEAELATHGEVQR